MRRWRLDTVLRLRALSERQARVRLARSLHQQELAGAELERRREAGQRRLEELGQLDAAQLRGLHLQGVRSAELLQQAAATYREAEERSAVDRLGWSEAVAEHDAVERVGERRRREAADLAQRVASDNLDDLVSLLRILRSRR